MSTLCVAVPALETVEVEASEAVSGDDCGCKGVSNIVREEVFGSILAALLAVCADVQEPGFTTGQLAKRAGDEAHCGVAETQIPACSVRSDTTLLYLAPSAQAEVSGSAPGAEPGQGFRVTQHGASILQAKKTASCFPNRWDEPQQKVDQAEKAAGTGEADEKGSTGTAVCGTACEESAGREPSGLVASSFEKTFGGGRTPVGQYDFSGRGQRSGVVGTKTTDWNGVDFGSRTDSQERHVTTGEKVGYALPEEVTGEGVLFGQAAEQITGAETQVTEARTMDVLPRRVLEVPEDDGAFVQRSERVAENFWEGGESGLYVRFPAGDKVSRAERAVPVAGGVFPGGPEDARAVRLVVRTELPGGSDILLTASARGGNLVLTAVAGSTVAAMTAREALAAAAAAVWQEWRKVETVVLEPREASDPDSSERTFDSSGGIYC